MPGTRVPNRTTATTPEEALFALDQIWTQVARYNISLSPLADMSSLGILISQWAVETDWGLKMLNHNWLNVPKDPEDLHNFTTRVSKQNYNGALLTVRDEIRSYDTLAEGGLDMILWLANNKYTAAWAFVVDGDCRGYLNKLEELGFFGMRASHNYKYSVCHIADRIRCEHPTRPDLQLPGDSVEEQERFNRQERDYLLNLVAMSLWSLSGRT